MEGNSSKMEEELEQEYKLNQLVFARCGDTDPWAAKVIKILENQNPIIYKVKFFNHNSTAHLYPQSLQPFTAQNIQKYDQFLKNKPKNIQRSLELALKEYNKKKPKKSFQKDTASEEEQVQESMQVNCSSRKIPPKIPPTNQIEAISKVPPKIIQKQPPQRRVNQPIQRAIDYTIPEDEPDFDSKDYCEFERRVADKQRLLQYEDPKYLLTALNSLIDKLILYLQSNGVALTTKEKQILHAILFSRQLVNKELIIEYGTLDKMKKFVEIYDVVKTKQRNSCYIDSVVMRSELTLWKKKAES